MTVEEAHVSEEVALFVSSEVEKNLLDQTAQRMPVWIAGTEANVELAKFLRQTTAAQITIFDVNLPLQHVKIATGITDLIHLHHASMRKLHVFGLPEGGELDRAWSEEGFELISSNPDEAVFACGEYVFE
jgi:hypothetical protein